MTNPNPFEAFASRHGLTMTAESVPFRPDRANDSWHDSALHFAVTIKTQAGAIAWRGFYSLGGAHAVMWAQKAGNPAMLAPVNLRRLPALSHYYTRDNVDSAVLRAIIRERYRRAAPLQIADILESLALDWRGAADAASFEEWADECGFDSDSRMAESMFLECRRGARAARAALGSETFGELLSLEHE